MDFLWQNLKKVTFENRCLFNRGDHLGRFDCNESSENNNLIKMYCYNELRSH
jgi:hypothetical protein